MEKVNRKLIQGLIEAETLIHGADHLVNVIFPVVRDPKTMLKALESLHRSLVLAFSVILKFEYLYRRITLTKDPKKNLNLFFEKCADNYGLNKDEKDMAQEILMLGRKHKESGCEFSKSGKLIIMDDELKIVQIDIGMMKKFVKFQDKLMSNIKRRFLERFRKV